MAGKITVQSVDTLCHMINEVSAQVLLDRLKVELICHRVVSLTFPLFADDIPQIICGRVAD